VLRHELSILRRRRRRPAAARGGSSVLGGVESRVAAADLVSFLRESANTPALAPAVGGRRWTYSVGFANSVVGRLQGNRARAREARLVDRVAAVTLATAAPPFSPMVSSGRRARLRPRRAEASARRRTQHGWGANPRGQRPRWTEKSLASPMHPLGSLSFLRHHGKLLPEMPVTTDSGFPCKSGDGPSLRTLRALACRKQAQAASPLGLATASAVEQEASVVVEAVEQPGLRAAGERDLGRVELPEVVADLALEALVRPAPARRLRRHERCASAPGGSSRPRAALSLPARARPAAAVPPSADAARAAHRSSPPAPARPAPARNAAGASAG
jgi:hypothetical protein